MRLTPPRTQPDRLLTDFGGLPPTEKKKKIKSGSRRCACSWAEHGSALHTAMKRPARPPLLLIFSLLRRG